MKRQILKLVRELGYEVVKRPDYQRMVSAIAAAATMSPSMSTPPVPPAVAEQKAAEMDRLLTPADCGDPEFLRFFSSLEARVAVPVPQLHALFAAVRFLTQARVPGAFVDCGVDPGTSLGIIAAALTQLGVTGRKLMSLDVTVDHRRWPDPTLPTWGADMDPLSGNGALARSKERPLAPLPANLAESGYPATQIVLLRYPRDPIEIAEPIAFLALANATYDSNRATVEALLPRVSPGGVIAVEAVPGRPAGADIVSQCIDRQRRAVFFWPITSDYRLGITAACPDRQA
jgi:O-methyltransferase